MENFEKIFEFLNIAAKLKTTIRYNSSDTRKLLQESTADHSWRLSLMAFMIADELKLDINKEKAVKIAIIHDLVESIAGDVDLKDIIDGKITREEKQKAEDEAIKKLRGMLPKEQGEEIYNLFMEYDKGLSGEGKFVRALDKIEGMTHVKERGHKAVDLAGPIALYGDEAVKEFPELKQVLKFIKKKLKEVYEEGNIPWKEEYGRV